MTKLSMWNQKGIDVFYLCWCNFLIVMKYSYKEDNFVLEVYLGLEKMVLDLLILPRITYFYIFFIYFN